MKGQQSAYARPMLRNIFSKLGLVVLAAAVPAGSLALLSKPPKETRCTCQQCRNRYCTYVGGRCFRGSANRGSGLTPSPLPDPESAIYTYSVELKTDFFHYVPATLSIEARSGCIGLAIYIESSVRKPFGSTLVYWQPLRYIRSAVQDGDSATIISTQGPKKVKIRGSCSDILWWNIATSRQPPLRVHQ